MNAVELIRRATDAGVSMTYGDGALQLRAERQPPAGLLAESIAHKIEIISSLNAANDPTRSNPWLTRVARLLDTRPTELLEGGHLDQHDLAELAGTDAALVA